MVRILVVGNFGGKCCSNGRRRHVARLRAVPQRKLAHLLVDHAARAAALRNAVVESRVLVAVLRAELLPVLERPGKEEAVPDGLQKTNEGKRVRGHQARTNIMCDEWHVRKACCPSPP